MKFRWEDVSKDPPTQVGTKTKYVGISSTVHQQDKVAQLSAGSLELSNKAAKTSTRRAEFNYNFKNISGCSFVACRNFMTFFKALCSSSVLGAFQGEWSELEHIYWDFYLPHYIMQDPSCFQTSFCRMKGKSVRSFPCASITIRRLCSSYF